MTNSTHSNSLAAAGGFAGVSDGWKTRLLQLSIGKKFGIGFTALLLGTAANYSIVGSLHDGASGLVLIVNETGGLRTLSQQMAYYAVRMELGGRGAEGEALEMLAGRFERTLSRIEGALVEENRALPGRSPQITTRLQALRREWAEYRQAVDTLRRSNPTSPQVRDALTEIGRTSAAMLQEADGLAGALTDTAEALRARFRTQLGTALALEGAFFLAFLAALQRGVTIPLQRLTRRCAELSAGEHGVRMRFQAGDEVGELVSAFNRTAERTERLVSDLNKRVREAEVLQRVARILQEEGQTVSAALQQVVLALPDGWLHNEWASARIVYDDVEYVTPSFWEGDWAQKVELACSAGQRLSVEVFYLEAHPDADEGPFLKEERALINTIGGMLKSYLEGVNAAHRHAPQFDILDETSDFVATFRPDGRLSYVNRAARRLLGLGDDADIARLAMSGFYPEWAKTVAEKVALPEASLRGTWSGEMALLSGDGKEVPVLQEIIAHKLPDGSVGHFSTVMRDISDRVEMEAKLTRSRDFFLKMLRDFPALVWRADSTGKRDYFNHAWLEFTGRSLEEEIVKGWPEGVHPDDAATCIRTYVGAVSRHEPFEMEYRLRRADGQYRWVVERGTPYYDFDDNFAGYIGSCYDISARKEAEEQLRLSLRAMESSVNAILITDARQPDQPIVYVNPAFERNTGYGREEVVGRNARFLLDHDQGQPEIEHIRAAVREQREGHALLRNYRKDGSLFWNELFVAPVRDEHGVVTHFVGVQNDITDRKRHEEELSYLANHDALTGLPNRNLLHDRIGQALALAHRTRRQVGVLFLDLDRFKFINDSLGHECGDGLLTAAAERLRASMREGDTIVRTGGCDATVARLGGDEFVVVLPDVHSEGDVARVARRILEVLSGNFEVRGHDLFVSASIGISLYPRDGTDVQTLLKNADSAMYRVKEGGRGNFQFYSPAMNEKAYARLSMENALRRALERGELLLHYQPQVDLKTGHISGVEALARWRSPELGDVSPADFIALAEETGLIVPLGEWVLRTACSQVRAWQASGLPHVRLAVNLSARQFRQRELAETIAQILEETGLEPKYLTLELTETVLMEDSDNVGQIMRRLKDLGVRFALDDFGTGYSSLGYLKRFSIDEVKIDRSFVQKITSNPENAAITLAIIGMAQSLNLRVVAEGVETEGQLGYLRRHLCHEIQGYYFSRPLPAEKVAKVLNGSRLRLGKERSPDGHTLLIVDDEPGTAAALERLLRRDGYRILTASSAEEGFELLAGDEVQVIVSDQRMPTMSGTEFLSRVKDLHPYTVRIMLSGYAEPNSLVDAINRGAIFKFLTKPWEDDLLRENIREAFCHYELVKDRRPRPSG